MSSLVISWIFAKSVTNAANLGLTYGIVGGVAYASYYFSFLIGGIVIFRMRTIGGYTSIHAFLSKKFGRTAVILFSLLIAFRLYNEVWSNTIVIGNYFGAQGSSAYYLAILIFTLLTLTYSLKGGLKSSLMTDAIQMALFAILLVAILTILIPKSDGVESMVTSGSWTLAGGVDLILVALIQSLSYPFHDPVLTDRGFISDPRKTLRSFLWAAPVGFISIVLFSLIGVYAAQAGLVDQAAVEVSKTLGLVILLLINFIMITSASSTLDSTFASFSKLITIDLGIFDASVRFGRLVMVGITILGTIPIFLDPEILSATTISGTMVIGLAPIFLFWQTKTAKSTFTITVLCGILFGVIYAFGLLPESWNWSNSQYGGLLVVNFIGTLICFIVFFIFKILKRSES